MQRTTKIMFWFGLIVGITWSVKWSLDEGYPNLWPILFMFAIPMGLVIIIQTIRKKPW